MSEAIASPSLSALFAQARAAIALVCDVGGSVGGDALANAGSLLEYALSEAGSAGQVVGEVGYRLITSTVSPGVQALVTEVTALADGDAILAAVDDLLSRPARD